MTINITSNCPLLVGSPYLPISLVFLFSFGLVPFLYMLLVTNDDGYRAPHAYSISRVIRYNGGRLSAMIGLVIISIINGVCFVPGELPSAYNWTFCVIVFMVVLCNGRPEDPSENIESSIHGYVAALAFLFMLTGGILIFAGDAISKDDHLDRWIAALVLFIFFCFFGVVMFGSTITIDGDELTFEWKNLTSICEWCYAAVIIMIAPLIPGQMVL